MADGSPPPPAGNPDLIEDSPPGGTDDNKEGRLMDVAAEWVAFDKSVIKWNDDKKRWEAWLRQHSNT